MRLSNIFPAVNPFCDCCEQAPASLAHMIWTCPSSATYWIKIFQRLSEIFQKPVKPDPELAVFGVGSVSIKLSLSKKQKKM